MSAVRCWKNTSPTWARIDKAGLSALPGSWKIMAMRLPRMARMRASEMARRSSVSSPVPPQLRQPEPEQSGQVLGMRPLPSQRAQPLPSQSGQRPRGRNMIEPPAMMPGGCGTRRRNERAVTLLPQPVSPTRPMVSPSRMSKPMPSTACTMPRLERKWTFRPATAPITAGARSAACCGAGDVSISAPSRSAGRGRRGGRRRPG